MSIFGKRTKKIPASEVEDGQQIVAIYQNDGLVDRQFKRHGRYPQVTSTAFLAKGEAGKPTVYIETDDSDGVWPLRPDEMVEVIA